MAFFVDRVDAGKRLASALKNFSSKKGIVIAIPRGYENCLRGAHNPKVGGSNPSPATNYQKMLWGCSSVGRAQHWQC